MPDQTPGFPEPYSGVQWGPLRGDSDFDLVSAWRELEAAAAEADGGPPPEPVRWFERSLEKKDDRGTVGIGAFDPHGRLVARGWIEKGRDLKNEYRVFLDGLVHPEFRRQGLGGLLLDWLVARGEGHLAGLPSDRGKTLRHDFYIRPSEAVVLLESRGFKFGFSEEEMRRALGDPLPEAPVGPDLAFYFWTPELAQDFYEVYLAAFSSRPGFPHWSKDVWVSAFTGDSAFRPDLTVLLKNEAGPVGYAMVDVESGTEEGFISQMGVAPHWRRQGYGVAVLVEVMRRLTAQGLQSVGLDVNENNPEAAGLYRKLGFKTVQRYTSYRKVISPVSAGDN